MNALVVALAVGLAAAPTAPTTAAAKTQKPAKDKAPKAAADRPPITIKSETFEAREGGKQFQWKTNVRIVRDDLKVDCDSLLGEGDDPNHLRTATCSGHAHMLQRASLPQHKEREAWGEVAVFDNQTAILTVTGPPQPHGRDGEDTLRGDKLIYDTNTDKLTAVGNVSMTVQNPPEKPGAKGGKTPEKKK